MKTTTHLGAFGAMALTICLVAPAGFAKPSESPVTAEQKAAFLKQATVLETDILADLATAEADARAKNLSPAEITAAIQTALQNTITKSGADPRAVLAALSAARSCPLNNTGYASDAVSLSCDASNSKALSKEGDAALAALLRIVVALIASDPAPGALGSNGTAPLSAPPTSVGGGGSSDYRI
jgi:hypothetical protein